MCVKLPTISLLLLSVLSVLAAKCVESFTLSKGHPTHQHESAFTRLYATAANPIDTDASPGNQSPTRKRLKPIPYVATTSTVEHSRALSHYLRPGDRVLELGTQLDAATSTICDTVGQDGTAILVDVRRTETKSGRSTQGSRDADKFLIAGEYGDRATFVELDQFEQWRTVIDGCVKSGINGDDIDTFDVLVLDVSAMCGNDLELTALSTVTEFVNHQLRRENRPRAVIIKSKSMSSLARRLVHAQRLFDGTASRDLRRPSRDGRPHIVAGVGVEEYRRTIPHVVRRGDAVLEVGCFSGVTTALLHDAATSPEEVAELEGEEDRGREREGFCIGVDIGPKIIVRAKRENPHMHFAVGDAWKSLDLLRLRSDAYPESVSRIEGYDVVYADIGGLSGPNGTLESLALLDVLGHGLQPRCIVIKSLCMRRLASSLRAYSDIWEKARAEEEEDL